MKQFCFPVDNAIFVNQSLHTYYMIWSKAECLHSMNTTSSYCVSVGTIRIKTSEKRLPLSVANINDFREHLPD